MNSYVDGLKQRSEANRIQAAERTKAKQEEEERNHRAWLRLCGSLSPIGRLSE